MSGFYGNPAERENNQNKTEYIPISELAREFGYAIDHLSRLCRQQRIDSIREANGRWLTTKESLTAYQENARQVKKEIASKNLGPRPKSLAPSSSLRISDTPRRVNLSVAFKTAFKFALLGIFVFFASSSIFAFAKNDDFKNSLKKVGQELVEIIIPSFKLTQDQKQITFTFGSEKFLNFKNLADELDLALHNFQSLSQNYSANLFNSYLSPVLDPVGGFLGRLFGEKSQTKTAELGEQVEELKKQLTDAHFKISNNEKILEEKIKEGLIVQENQIIRETEREKTTVTERRIVTIPSNVETRLLSVERLTQGSEQRFKNIELTLASIDDRFSYTPTILVTSGGGGGNQGITISNPATTDSETVKVSRLLDVSGSAEIDGSLTLGGNFTVDTNTFFVDSEKNRVGIGTLNLDTAFEVVGTASISNNLFVGSRVGINTTSPTTSLEVQGTASASYLLTGNTLQVGGFASVAYSRFGTLTTSHSNYISASNDVLVSGDIEVRGTASFGSNASVSGDLFVFGKIGIGTTNLPNQLTVVGSGSFTGQLKATRNPTIAHTGTWPSFTNTNDSTLYINPSSPVADGNVIAYTNGSDPKFVVDAEGDVFAAGNLTLVGTTTQATTNVTGDLTVEGNARLGDAVSDKIKIPGTVLPYTLSSFPLLIKASASQTVDVFRIRDSSDNPVLTVDQGTGLLTASSGFNFYLGFSTATVSYSRLGTATTGYSSDIDKFNDLLISGALEVDGNSFFDGKASISGNFQTGGRFILGDNGDTGEINTSDWDISNTGNLSGIGTIAADGAYTQTGTGANTFSGATTFSSIGNALLVSAGRSETQGTASASYFLTGNTLQVGGFASAAYSRIGTNTTTYSRLGDTNDLLITDDLEVDGTTWFDGTVNFSGTASSSLFYAQPGTAASPSFSFAIDQDTGMFRRAVNALGFSTLGSERLTILSDGNVGVGTTVPLAPLHVLGQCVTGDTRLRRRRRKRNLELGTQNSDSDDQAPSSKLQALADSGYFYDEVAIRDIQPGDEILTLDEKIGQLVYQKVKALMDMGIKPIFKLTTASGKTIRTTGNHPYLLQTKSELPNRKPKLGVFFDNANMFYAQKEAGWKIDLDKLRKELSDSFDIKLINFYTALPDKSDPAYKPTAFYLKKISKTAALKTKPLKYIEIAKGKYEKKGDLDVDIVLDVARTIHQLDAVLVVSGDSDFLPLKDYVVKENRKKIAFAGFESSIAWELRQSKHLYLNRYKNALIETVDKKQAPSFGLGVVLLSSLYSRAPSLSSGGKWTKVKNLKKDQKIAIFDGKKAIWDSISNIELLPPEQVYDIEVEGTHNFVGNDIIAHNTFITGRTGINTTAPSTTLEVQGTASASYLLTGNTLQVGGFASAAYSRFGTATATDSAIGASNDLLISDSLEVDGTFRVDGTASHTLAGEWNFDSNTLGIDSGTNRVGIATSPTSLDTTLEVGGTASVSGNLTFGGTITSNNTGSNSFSGGLEVTKGVHATGSITTGTDLRVNGNTTLGDAAGDTLTSNTDAWTLANDTNFTLSGGVNGLSFDTNTFSVDAANNRVGILTTAPQTTFEVQGTASASYLLTGNTLQVGGFASAAYSRFGTATATDSAINTTNDLLISGALEVDDILRVDGTGTHTISGLLSLSNASVSGNFELTGNTKLGINSGGETTTSLEVGGTASISGATTLRGITYTWPSADGSSGQQLQTNGSGTLSWAAAGGVSSNSIDFDEIVNTMLLDSNLTINRGGYYVGLGAAPSTVFEVQGTASASYLLTGNTLQVGGFASAAYSRFGTATATDSSVDTTNDLLISGSLEVDSVFRVDGTGSHTLAGEWNFDSNTLGIDSGTNRVGIATSPTSLDTTLEVGGTASISGATTLRGVTYTWPSSQGAANTFLKNDGSGNLSWGTAGGWTLKSYTTCSGVGTCDVSSLDLNTDIAYMFVINVNSAANNVGIRGRVNANTGLNQGSGSFRINQAGTTAAAGQVSADFWDLSSGVTYREWAGEIVVSVTAQDGPVATWKLVGRQNGVDTNAGSHVTGSAWKDDTTNMTSMRFYTSTGDTKDWKIWTLVPKQSGGADLAEWIPSNDDSLEAGDIVTVDGQFGSLVKKSLPGENTAVGIVSTKPGLIIGEERPENDTAGYALVALAGRVPVKVTEENGAIVAGDRLTLSKTKPGYAMKQTEAGQSIGIALENRGSDKILTFVNLSYWAPTVNDLPFLSSFSSSSFNLASSSSSTLSLNTLFSSILNQFKQLGIFFENGFDELTGSQFVQLTVNGIVKAKEFIAEKITAKELCLEDVCVNKEQLKTLLEKNQINLISNYSNSPNQTPMTNDEITEKASSSEETPSPTLEPSPVVEVGESSSEETESADFTTGQSPEPPPKTIPTLESSPSESSSPTSELTPEPTPELNPETTLETAPATSEAVEQ